MAGEFLQLLAHFARENKAERDADSRVIQNMVGRRMEESYDIAKTNNQRQYDLIQSDLKGQTGDINLLSKEIEIYQAGLKQFGVTINKYDELDDQDKTKDADDMLNVSLKRLNYEYDDADFKNKNLVERKASNVRDLQKLTDRRDFLRGKYEDWDNLNQSLELATKKIYSEEYNRMTAGEAGGDLLLTKQELEVWKGDHAEEYAEMVKKYNGDSDLVDIKIQDAFKGFTSKDLKDLLDVEAYRSNKVERQIKERDELSMDAVVLKAVKATDLNVNKALFNARGIRNQWGDHSGVTQATKDKFAFLAYSTDSGGALSTEDGNVNKASYNQYINRLGHRMAGVIKSIELEVGSWDPDKKKGLRYHNDEMLMAMYYTGQVRKITDKEREEGLLSPYAPKSDLNPDGLDYPEEWHDMIPVFDPLKRADASAIHVAEIGMTDKSLMDGHDATQKEVDQAKLSLSKFMYEFIEGNNQYINVKKAEQPYSMLPSQTQYDSPFKAQIYSHNKINNIPLTASGTSREELSANVKVQEEKDKKNKFDQAILELNLDGEDATMKNWARSRGFEDDIDGAIDYYFKLGNTPSERRFEYQNWVDPSRSSSTEAERESQTFIGKASDPGYKYMDAASLAVGIKKLEPLLEKAYKDFIHQGGSEDKQYHAKKLWLDNSEKGYKTAAINARAVEMLKELELKADEIKHSDPKEYDTMQYWIKRFRGIFTESDMDKYKKGSKYSEQWGDLIFDVYPDLVRPD